MYTDNQRGEKMQTEMEEPLKRNEKGGKDRNIKNETSEKGKTILKIYKHLVTHN